MNSVRVQRLDETVGASTSVSKSIDFTVISSNSMKSEEVIEFEVPFSQFILTGSIQDVTCESFGPNGFAPVPT